MANNIYELELHETFSVDKFTEVLRVPGGWVYTSFVGSETITFKPIGSTFVPYSEEFKPADPIDSPIDDDVPLD